MNVQDPQLTVGDVQNTEPQPESVPQVGHDEAEPPAKFEYEFTFTWDGKPMFVTVWDTNDRSACERVLCHPVKQEDITFSDTGNGFVTDKDGGRWSFHKEPYKQTYGLHNEISAEGGDVLDTEPTPRRRKQPASADSILAGI